MSAKNLDPSEDSEFARSESRVDAAFLTPRRLEMKAPPFLASRVLARAAAEASGKSSQPLLWQRLLKNFFLVAAGAAAGIGGVTFLYSGASLDAVTNKQMVLLINSAGAPIPGVVFVQVDLPKGIEFYSEQFPEVANRASLVLPFAESGGAESSLPVMIKGLQAGVQAVKIHFLDANRREIANRTVTIRFRPEDRSA